MRILTPAEFLNALDGKFVAVGLSLQLCKQSASLVDNTVDNWTRNASSMELSKFDDYHPLYVQARKLNSFLLHTGEPLPLSVLHSKCYLGDNGCYFVVSRHDVYIGGVLHHSARLTLLEIKP